MIAPARIEQVVHVIHRAGLGPETLAHLRAEFCDPHFTYCEDDDVGTASGTLSRWIPRPHCATDSRSANGLGA